MKIDPAAWQAGIFRCQRAALEAPWGSAHWQAQMDMAGAYQRLLELWGARQRADQAADDPPFSPAGLAVVVLLVGFATLLSWWPL